MHTLRAGVMEKEQKETILSETGKFMIDIAKLVFGGVILAGIMEYEDMSRMTLFTLGSASVIVLFIAGLVLCTLSKSQRKEN